MSKVQIKIDTTKYRTPTQDEVDKARQYALNRGRAANLVVRKLNDRLSRSTKDLVSIGYKYNVEGITFQWNSVPAMYDEVTELMDKVYEDCMVIIEDNAIPSGESDDKKTALILYLLSLGRKNRTFSDTLEEYLWRYLYDIEAFVAATKIANLSKVDAMTRIVSGFNSVYTDPLVMQAMKVPNVQSMYLANGGVHTDRFTGEKTQGVPINGSAAVTNLASIVVNQVWFRNESIDLANNGVVGYYQLRGSSYPCAICDAQVGFHPASNPMELPQSEPVHPHCVCFRVPIFAVTPEELENLL